MYIGPAQSLVILGISLSINYCLFNSVKMSRMGKAIATVIFGFGWWLIALLFLSPAPL